MRSSGPRLLLAVAVLGVAISTLAPASAASLKCPWGKTSTGTCVNPVLAQMTQRATLVFTQLQINHNFSPYLPANPNVERLYPIRDVAFFQRLN